MLCRLHEASELIRSGATLVAAGSPDLLRRLPPGKWIGGTSTSAFTPSGGAELSDRLQITTFPEQVTLEGIQRYGVGGVQHLSRDLPVGGFSVLIVPHASNVHDALAREALLSDRLLQGNLFGWMSEAVRWRHLGRPQVYYGPLAHCIEDEAVALHFSLSPGWRVRAESVSVFGEGDSESFRFPSDGFSASRIIVGGEELDFVSFMKEKRIDLDRPLVSRHGGRVILTCPDAPDSSGQTVRFHSPVFHGVDYRFAKAVPNLEQATRRLISSDRAGTTLIACLCLMSYVEGSAEDYPGALCEGPVTRGEIAGLPTSHSLARAVLEPVSAG